MILVWLERYINLSHITLRMDRKKDAESRDKVHFRYIVLLADFLKYKLDELKTILEGREKVKRVNDILSQHPKIERELSYHGLKEETLKNNICAFDSTVTEQDKEVILEFYNSHGPKTKSEVAGLYLEHAAKERNFYLDLLGRTKGTIRTVTNLRKEYPFPELAIRAHLLLNEVNAFQLNASRLVDILKETTASSIQESVSEYYETLRAFRRAIYSIIKELSALKQAVSYLYQEYEAEKRKVDIIAKSQKNKIEKEYGSLDAFHKNLEVGVINSPDDKALDELYGLYSQIFTIPEERETLDGFKECLKFNMHQVFQNQFGFFEEYWIYIRDKSTKKIIAAGNSIVYSLPGIVPGISGTEHAVYLLVSPEYRSIKVGKKLFDFEDNYAKNRLAGIGNPNKLEGTEAALTENPHTKIIVFGEQNAPELMTLKDYLEDSRNARLDQCDRLQIFLKWGYNRCNFRYIQPPLAEGEDPCDFLTFIVKQPGTGPVSGEIIYKHLDRFFTVSVLKGVHLADEDEYYMQQKAELQKKGMIETSGSAGYYADMKRRVYELVKKARSGEQVPQDKLLGEIIGLKLEE